MRKIQALLIALCLSVAAGVPTSTLYTASDGILVDPIKETINLTADGSYTATLQITNHMDISQDVEIGFKEFTVDSAGMPSDLTTPGADDPASWFTATPAQFTFAPGETRSVAIKVTAPATAKSIGYYVAADILIGPGGESQSSNETRQEIQTLYSVVVGNPPENLEITQISRGEDAIVIRLHNPALVHTTASGKLDILEGSEVVETYTMNPVNIFPNKYRDVTISVDNLEREDYVAKISLAYGKSNTVITSEQDLSVAPTVSSSQAVTVKNTATVVNDDRIDLGKILMFGSLGFGLVLIISGAVLTLRKK